MRSKFNQFLSHQKSDKIFDDMLRIFISISTWPCALRSHTLSNFFLLINIKKRIMNNNQGILSLSSSQLPLRASFVCYILFPQKHTHTHTQSCFLMRGRFIFVRWALRNVIMFQSRHTCEVGLMIFQKFQRANNKSPRTRTSNTRSSSWWRASIM
jgi:hypothetical protein